MLTEGELQCFQRGSCNVNRVGVAMFSEGSCNVYKVGELLFFQTGQTFTVGNFRFSDGVARLTAARKCVCVVDDYAKTVSA